jgi:hypothetical protein
MDKKGISTSGIISIPSLMRAIIGSRHVSVKIAHEQAGLDVDSAM